MQSTAQLARKAQIIQARADRAKKRAQEKADLLLAAIDRQRKKAEIIERENVLERIYEAREYYHITDAELTARNTPAAKRASKAAASRAGSPATPAAQAGKGVGSPSARQSRYSGTNKHGQPRKMPFRAGYTVGAQRWPAYGRAPQWLLDAAREAGVTIEHFRDSSPSAEANTRAA